MKKVFLFCLSLGFLTACTNQQMYEAVQENRIQDCDKYGYEGSREECRELFQTSYEEYRESREANLED